MTTDRDTSPVLPFDLGNLLAVPLPVLQFPRYMPTVVVTINPVLFYQFINRPK